MPPSTVAVYIVDNLKNENWACIDQKRALDFGSSSEPCTKQR